MKQQFLGSICVVGGCGHVGLPLAVALAASGAHVTAYDTNTYSVSQINEGNVPFFEDGLDVLLRQELGRNHFVASTDIGSVGASEIIIVVIGTPVDEHLNPDPTSIRKVLESLTGHWDGLTLFVNDPRIPMDNNYGDRLICGPAVGRKNY